MSNKKKPPPAPTPLFDTLAQTNPAQAMLQQNISLPAHIEQAPQDYAHSYQFLYSYRGSEATFNAYRRELERLLHWSWRVANKSIAALKREDIEQFIEFCQQPPLTWIGVKQVSRFVNRQGLRQANREWRPYVCSITKKAHRHGGCADTKQYSLSANALQAIFSVLGSFYQYLLQEDYCGVNPVAQIRQKSKYLRKQQSQRVIRRLSNEQWHYVIEAAERMAREDPAQHERTLFIMTLLFAMYLRISELVATSRWSPKMGDFNRDTDNNWWFTTVGKGNKERQVSVSDAMLAALQRYRSYLGLTPLPALGEKTPLIMKNKGQGIHSITSTRQIRNIVQNCFDQAIMYLQKDNLLEDADRLMSATVHWLRHTGISEDVQHRPREHVRDDAGHSSSATTDKYIDVELRARHKSAKKKPVKLQ